jgi:uncharacterized protein YbgA (DUF1722 family)/uncharacterized protein YbbK (DUF523 family)
MDKIRLGISTCLLGENVRYDGGHKLDRYLRDTLGACVEYVPVCPEVECGLGVPRESMHLEGDPRRPRLVTTRTGKDLTERMEAWARRRTAELEKENLCGFVFKSDSPSSGMERVRVYGGKGNPPVRTGVGLFARIFMERFPLLPVEEEGRLHDPLFRENFIERIFTCQRWHALTATGRKPSGLVKFHTVHKLLLLSHSEKHYREMGKLVARAGTVPDGDLFAGYETLLMEAFRLKSTPAKNTNVLQHMAGYFKKQLSPGERQELQEIIGEYRRGEIPLIVPVTLIRHYVRKFDEPYLRDQVYLHPHPQERKLRNHA